MNALAGEDGVDTGVDTDVVVVGAGPVGLTAAALLAGRGVGVTVLERLKRPSAEPKAISLDDASLRTYQSVGLAHAGPPRHPTTTREAQP